VQPSFYWRDDVAAVVTNRQRGVRVKSRAGQGARGTRGRDKNSDLRRRQRPRQIGESGERKSRRSVQVPEVEGTASG
jgi:hypothetical protein